MGRSWNYFFSLAMFDYQSVIQLVILFLYQNLDAAHQQSCAGSFLPCFLVLPRTLRHLDLRVRTLHQLYSTYSSPSKYSSFFSDFVNPSHSHPSIWCSSHGYIALPLGEADVAGIRQACSPPDRALDDHRWHVSQHIPTMPMHGYGCDR